MLKISALADANLKDSNAIVARRTANQMALAIPGLKAESTIDESLFGKTMRVLGLYGILLVNLLAIMVVLLVV